jgi:multiple sugar transport system substrate-binding protein
MIVLRGMTWDHPRGYDPMVATARAYEADHPGISIRWEKRSLQAFADRPVEVMAREFDLMVIDHPHAGAVAESGHVVDLRTTVPPETLAALAEQSVGLSHVSYEYAGGQWALAIDAATPVASYRPERLDRVPERWDEVIRLAEKKRVVWPVKPVDALMNFFNLAANCGFDVAKAKDRLIDPSDGRVVLDAMLAVVRHLPVDCLAMNPIEAYERLADDGGADYCPYAYGYVNYARTGFRRHLLRFADTPALGAEGPRGSCLGGTGLAISALCEHCEAALDYALWVASADCQKGLYFDSGGQPANAAAWDDDRCNALSGDFFRNTRRTLDRSWMRPRYDGYISFQDAGGEIVNACLAGSVSISAALEQLDDAYRSSFSQ